MEAETDEMEKNSTEFIMASNYICHDNGALCWSWEPVGHSVTDGASGLRVCAVGLTANKRLSLQQTLYSSKLPVSELLLWQDMCKGLCNTKYWQINIMPRFYILKTKDASTRAFDLKAYLFFFLLFASSPSSRQEDRCYSFCFLGKHQHWIKPNKASF